MWRAYLCFVRLALNSWNKRSQRSDIGETTVFDIDMILYFLGVS